MLIVGIPEAKFPGRLETQVMLNYIKKNYPGHTCDEIRLAFDKAIAGELPIEMKDVKAYNNFSVLYLGSIMRAYREWAKTEYNEGNVPTVDRNELPAPQLTQEEQEAQWRETYEFWKTEILSGIKIDFVPSSLFDIVIWQDKVTPSEAGTLKALKKANEHLQERLAIELVATDPVKKSARFGEILKEQKTLQEKEVSNWQEIPVVQKLAKAFWCLAYFNHITFFKDGQGQ